MARYHGPLLTRAIGDALLAARDAGATAWTGSLDLGLTSDDALLYPDHWEWRGQRLAYPGKLKDRSLYWWDGDAFEPVSRYAGRLIKEGIAARRACHVAVTWGITDDPQVQRSLDEVVAAIFP